MRKGVFAALVFWAGLVLFSLLRISTPPPLEVHAPGTWDAVRTHLEHIAAEPHPVASPGHERVQQYLVAEIRKLGLPVEVQEVPISRITDAPRWAPPEASLKNVMTRIAGSGEGKALLLASHYDSAPPSFGAGDDGAAVASMLDLLAKSVNAGFANDLIFLFTDAEESCLCGARAFVREHRWAADVGLVLNFEARGTSGRSVLFEATPGYGNLVRAYARHAVSPTTSSLYQVVYELLPNDTDLSAFREGGMRGLNMAFIDSQQNYHTAADTVENLDPRTAMHQYANMRAMLAAFADADLGQSGTDEPVFFDLLGFAVVVYGKFVLWAGAAAACVLTAYVLRQRVQQQRLGMGRLALAALVLLFAAAALVWGMKLVSDLIAESAAVAAIGKKGYLGTCIVLGMLAYGAIARQVGRRLGNAAVDSAILLVWLALLLLTSALLPGVSYIFLWPLLGVLVARWLASRMEAGALVAETFAYVPLLIIWAQLAYALLLAMSIAGIALVIAPMLLAGALLQTQRLTARREGENDERDAAATA